MKLQASLDNKRFQQDNDSGVHTIRMSSNGSQNKLTPQSNVRVPVLKGHLLSTQQFHQAVDQSGGDLNKTSRNKFLAMNSTQSSAVHDRTPIQLNQNGSPTIKIRKQPAQTPGA